MRKCRFLTVGIAGVLLLLQCTGTQSPFSNPADAKIVDDKSLKSLDALHDSLAVSTSYACTVEVYLPRLIDSFYVHLSRNGKDTLTAAGKVSGTTFTFQLSAAATGTYGLNVIIVKSDDSRDSMSRAITIYSSLVTVVVPLKDSLLLGRAYACSCAVSHPELVDSISSHLLFGTSDTIVFRGPSTPAFGFRFSAPVAGAFSLRIAALAHGVVQDSLTVNLTGYLVIAPEVPAIHLFTPPDSFTFRFAVTDLDSTLWGGYTWTGSTMNNSQQTIFPPKNQHHSGLMRTVHILADTLVHRFPDTIVCNAVVLYPDSTLSSVVQCSLFVGDTSKPQILLVSPQDTVNPQPSPITIRALVTDIVGVDSVTFNGASMVFSKDTALFVASLDSGRHADSIIAIDKAGNKGKLLFTLAVQGKPRIPPQIKDLSRAVTEGIKFDTLLLDTCVTINDTSISIANKPAFIKDSLTWIITDSAGTQLSIPATHKIIVPQSPDTEWTGTIKLTFKVWVTNSPSLYDTKQPSFFVTEVKDPPAITLRQYWCSTRPYHDTIYLDTVTTVRDPDNTANSLSWSFKNGKHFKVDSLYNSRIKPVLPKKAIGSVIDPINPILPIYSYFNRHIRIDTISVADTAFHGTDTLLFTVTDPTGLAISKQIFFSRQTFCFIYIGP